MIGLLLALAATIVSCGGSQGPVNPSDESNRILGILDPSKAIPSLIAFTRALADSTNPYGVNRELYVMGPNGMGATRLTFNPADDDYPAFSPKGFALAFTSNRDSVSWGNHDIYRYNSPSSIWQLTNEAWEFDSTATDWAPGFIAAAQLNTLIKAPFDVVRIAAVSPVGKWESYIDTGQIANYDPTLKRDGSQVVFCARPSGPGYFGSMELYIMDLTSGSTSHQLSFFGPDPDHPVYTRNPAFDYSGIRVVFETTLWDDNWEIGFVNLASMAPVLIPVRITENKADDVQPCWDPSGNWIAFCSNRNGNFEIYKQWLGGDHPSPNNPVRLTFTKEDESNPDWGPAYKNAP
jgi:Tol biopolymer transport system component